MIGGIISNNVMTPYDEENLYYDGAGVYMDKSTVILGGTATIINNVCGKRASDLILDSDTTLTLEHDSSGNPTLVTGEDGARIGIATMYRKTGVLLTGSISEEQEKCFFSDDKDYCLKRCGDELHFIKLPHTHADGTEFGRIVNGKSTVLYSGYYYLEDDCDLNDQLTIPENETVTLCLNGKKLNETKSTSAIKISKGAAFTLCDCDHSTTHADTTAVGGLICSAGQDYGRAVKQ